MTSMDIKTYLARNSTCLHGVYYFSSPESFKEQEELYLEVRRKEGRVYPDAVVRMLPRMDHNHPLYSEWRIRETSLNRFLGYLGGWTKPLTILDIGCGNGWMAHRMACAENCEVYGLDLNQPELEQGARVFPDKNNLTFLYGNIFENILPPENFDLVTLAGSVQYFQSTVKLLERCFFYLKEKGEVHLIDSPFYTQKTVGVARERSRSYYEDLGYPEMASCYHHHLYSNLDTFHPEFLYNPGNPLQRIRRRLFNRHLSPFPWIRLVK